MGMCPKFKCANTDPIDGLKPAGATFTTFIIKIGGTIVANPTLTTSYCLFWLTADEKGGEKTSKYF
jgi:hypothetical protein